MDSMIAVLKAICAAMFLIVLNMVMMGCGLETTVLMIFADCYIGLALIEDSRG